MRYLEITEALQSAKPPAQELADTVVAMNLPVRVSIQP
jgi:hypothetical protein